MHVCACVPVCACGAVGRLTELALDPLICVLPPAHTQATSYKGPVPCVGVVAFLHFVQGWGSASFPAPTSPINSFTAPPNKAASPQHQLLG